MRSLRSASKHITYHQHYKASLSPFIHGMHSPNCLNTSRIRYFTTKASLPSFIPPEYQPDQRILNLVYGFLAGTVFISLYNREFPGYERRIRRRANRGDASAMVEYGQYLLSKKNEQQAVDPERYAARAFNLFQRASECGNKTAHYYLGLLHKMEKIEAPNPKAAFHHFMVAADDNDECDAKGTKHKNTISDTLKMQSKYELGLSYLEGFGVDQDKNKGMMILEDIGKNNGDAAFILSQIYANGRYGVSMNSVRALSWKKESAKLGNRLGTQQMDELYLAKGRELIDKEVPNIDAFDNIKAPM